MDLKFKQYIAAGVIAVMLISTGCGANGSEKQDGTEIEENINAETSEEVVGEEGNVPEEEVVPEVVEAPLDIRFIKKSNLNVRLEPSAEAEVIGTLDSRTEVVIAEEFSDENGLVTWLRLEESLVAEKESWVSADSVVKNKYELMHTQYEGVDYSPVRDIPSYRNNPPVEVKGIYVTQHSASNETLDKLIKLADETEINTFVIDVKDDNGNMLFETKAAGMFCPEANTRAPIKDVKAFVEKLREHDIYLIARIVTFKSPKYAKRYPERAISYKNSNKLYKSGDNITWASPHDRQLWAYNIEVSREAAEAGFNEIQFDYVRFPATGKALDKSLDFKDVHGESKTLVIHNFLKYAREKLTPYQVYISADIFGWSATSLNDVGIGQHWESMSNVVDYTSPMMYPSHYGPNNFGLSVPDAFPYETVDGSIKDALKRDANLEKPAILRPWIQDFTAKWVKGYISYRAPEVRAQIQALEDNGVNQFLLWNAVNRYTEGGLKSNEIPVVEPIEVELVSEEQVESEELTTEN